MTAAGTVNPAVQRTAPKRGMQKAGDAARAGGWQVGTMLRSEQWSGDRQIEELVGPEIRLRSSYRGGSTCSWVKSVPADTVAVPT